MLFNFQGASAPLRKALDYYTALFPVCQYLFLIFFGFFIIFFYVKKHPLNLVIFTKITNNSEKLKKS